MSEILKPAPRGVELPSDLAERLNGELSNQIVLAYSELDLDAQNRLAQSFLVLTQSRLIRVAAGEKTSLPVESVTKATIREGLGMDRLLIESGQGRWDLRYSRTCRHDVVRLHRHLKRLTPNDEGKIEEQPQWLEKVELEAELQEKCRRCGHVIPAYADSVCPRCAQSRTILWRLMDVARPYRTSILVALVLTLFHAGVVSIEPLVRKYLIDKAIIPVTEMTGSQRLDALLYWSLVTVGVIILSELIGGVRMWLLSNIGTKVTADLRHKVYQHLHSLSLRFYAKRRTGSLITRVTSDTDRIWDFIAFGSINLVRDIAMITAMMTIMFWQNWVLALVALAPLPMIAVITYWRGKKMHKLFGRMWGYWSRVS
ncbi:MAG TPA: ABC transporter transmembrane domain-containing protein, partial [Tepidisphaeraceae bacterium]